MRLTKSLRTALKANASIAPTARIYTFPAPTGGWNTRDPLNGMKPNDAVVLDNYFPSTADVQLRGGSTPWATGMTGTVETVVPYSKNSTNEMWAFADGKIYDVSSQAAVGAPVVSGLTNDRWQDVTFTTSGDTRLVLVNGEDKMLQYDGTTWHVIDGVSVPVSITGVNTDDLINVWAFKKRLFFIEKNSMNAWYLPTDSFGGVALKIDLGTLFRDGGYLIAGGTWTRDGGDGMDDLCVFLSSKGEVAIYQGDDPADADHWSQIGRYQIGPPIGYRCLVQTGADLAIISIDGILGLSTIITLDRAASNKVALSNKIVGSFAEATGLYRNNFGWEAIAYPAKNQVLFNIPILEGSEQQQYVLNTLTGSWCRFKGWNANAWCFQNERIYFGTNDGEVWIADDGDSDNGEAIAGLIKTAFSYLNAGSFKKEFKLVRPTIFSDISLSFGVSIVVDFDASTFAPIVSSTSNTGFSIWNIATWNVDPWATLSSLATWKKANGLGRCAAVVFATNTIGYTVKLSSVDVMYERAGIL